MDDKTRAFVERVANLNRDAGEIGAGMLASLVDDARGLLHVAGMSDAEIRKDCEIRFQSGGPRVYIIDRARWAIRNWHDTAASAVRMLGEGTEVWARRKVPGVTRWEWKKVSK